jgi:hypothetical protein
MGLSALATMSHFHKMFVPHMVMQGMVIDMVDIVINMAGIGMWKFFSALGVHTLLRPKFVAAKQLVATKKIWQT